ncbi:uncharacterized protein LOC127087884 [Lathyrus oleraceus]|uniref:uncharacterized protein LOC127087884 n=1 Tax=Pisum sativum TaxID=3888 RepID=UPI0021D37DDE|nr:uncharacterized protein LOC127087884 [Pisum sativum]
MSSQLSSECCMKVMKEEAIKASTEAITIFDLHRQIFSVQETMEHNEGRPNLSYVVILNRSWCDCGKFQAFHIPCPHVFSACTLTRQDAYNHLSDVYKVITVMNVYNESFYAIAMEERWPQYQGDIVSHNDEMRRKKKGRPNNTRIRIEMDMADKMIRLCSICRQPEHNKKKYPNLGATSAS